MDRNFWRAYGLYAGGVIGVGVFALPRALVSAGLAAFLLQLVVVGILAWWIQRSFLAVVAATPGRHRFPGYVRAHLGRPAYAVAAVVNIAGLVGALVAYLLAGSLFLRLLLAPWLSLTPDASLLLYLLPGAALLLWGLRALPAIELAILGLFLFVLLGLPLAAGRALTVGALPTVGPLADLLLPYGVLLFSFWGVSLIPETRELAGRNTPRTLAALAAGALTAAVAYAFFAIVVAGITGVHTTEDALTGLRAVLGDGVVFGTLLFGVLTTFSSYLALGVTLLRTLRLDLEVGRLLALVVTIGLPLGLVAVGFDSLLLVLSLTGAVFLGTEGLLVFALRWRVAPPEARRGGLRLALTAGGALLVVGVVTELLRAVVP